MPKLTLMAGLPGSGKSTLAREVARKNPGRSVIVERDMVRYDIMGLEQGSYDFDYNTENKVTVKQEDMIRTYLKNGLDVIVSDTNLREKYLKNFMRLAEELDAEVDFIDLRDIPLDEVLRRNKLREKVKHVPEEVILKMHENFVRQIKKNKFGILPPMDKWDSKSKFNFEEVEPYKPFDSGTRTYLLDLDGTVADHLGVRSPYDTTKYHLDNVHEEVRELVETLHNSGSKVIVMTGRHQDHRAVVEKWLEDKNIPYDEMYMREDPQRSDDEEKLLLFEKHLRNRKDLNIRGVFDDRLRVVKMWRDVLKLRVYHVHWGDF